jgi:hypothetical protein
VDGMGGFLKEAMTEFTDYAEFSSLRLETLKANNI